MVNLLCYSLSEGQLNKSNERSPFINESTPGKPESKTQSMVKGVDKLVRLLPFACALKSSDPKA